MLQSGGKRSEPQFTQEGGRSAGVWEGSSYSNTKPNSGGNASGSVVLQFLSPAVGIPESSGALRVEYATRPAAHLEGSTHRGPGASRACHRRGAAPRTEARGRAGPAGRRSARATEGLILVLASEGCALPEVWLRDGVAGRTRVGSFVREEGPGVGAPEVISLRRRGKTKNRETTLVKPGLGMQVPAGP